MPDLINKKEAKRITTRKRILEAATHLFARLGYHKTTIQDIANHIDMTTGAVFHHYDSKPDILEEVVKELDHSFDKYIEYLSQDHIDYKKMITGMMIIFKDQFNYHPDTIIALASLAAEFSGIRGAVIVKIQAAYDKFVDAFEDSLDRICLKKSNRAAAVCFISGLQGVALQALVRNDEMDINDLVDGFISLVT
ncbi:MAG: TetR/AcrR family transcriptional regulator [Desulfobacula sp.]|jgi:AcrR family transcriptional regulator|uniref:TetR/AcrR family transcriptional regulator n=1 Tax=Desulfobacula sp. TaxID=2593537 RepID=UPI001D9B87E5|nr:TetR/AcrR family transcriptional regulator [Desulfobacula sp.]MBT3484027.1 TetR/AcrR family transcriptional regulator [Desulfobacula sp.]MBT3805969.1 TetR/AcrR family transcriptional regulator [Desulfobacula sp.]MBT4026346.1 TetR/AcrR family transcriptional regulator [Desulfobacula sp.]MBT4198109.1 TetR/AcrR family transcriptional regulator [Desulfobacula sp.]